MAPVLNIPAAAPAFLAAHGWAGAGIHPLAGDASFRRYFRVALAGRSAMLMDAPPPEDPRPFLAMARWLRAHDFLAPEVYAEDLATGLVLLQDFGDARLKEVVDAEPERETALYGAAIDLLVRLHRQAAAPLSPYDLAVCQREADLLPQWYCPALGLEVDEAGYAQAWEQVLTPLLSDAPVTVLRDYHAENLMLLADGTLGLLDFQDALAGHRAYDLVSLLQDARRDVSADLEAAMLERYRQAAGADAAFDAAYHALGAQRNAKIVGIFTRLWRRDGKPRYTAMMPRVWNYLERDLAHPALAPVARWFADNIPPTRRGDPMRMGQS